jgi:hypothetical protein
MKSSVARYGRGGAHGVRRRHGIGSFFKKIGSGFKKAAGGVKKGVTKAAKWATSDAVKKAVRGVREQVEKHADLADLVRPGLSDKIRTASATMKEAGYGMRLRPLATGRRNRMYTRKRSYRRRR